MNLKLIGIALVSALGLSQSQTTPTPPPPKFDVALIKRSPPGELSPSNPAYVRPGNAPGECETKNVPLIFLMQVAYGVNHVYIYNVPSWARSDWYDIRAKTELTPEEAQKIGTSLEERQADVDIRLQSLLEDRFRLKIHRETREVPAVILTVAKGGPKVQPSDCVTRGSYRFPEQSQPPIRYCGTYSILRAGVGWKLTATGITMKTLVYALSQQELPTLIDQTEYTEPFNAIMEWTSDSARPPEPLPSDAAPSLSSALQEQLGLTLKSGKASVEVLVVDHVERPSEN